MLNWIYVRYRALIFFLGLVFRRDDKTMPRFMPRETWEIAWHFWRDWDCNRYRRTWIP